MTSKATLTNKIFTKHYEEHFEGHKIKIEQKQGKYCSWIRRLNIIKMLFHLNKYKLK